jgi:hypothetical protein
MFYSGATCLMWLFDLSDKSGLDHSFQDHFQCHGMAAAPAGLKEVAIASPAPSLILYRMGIVRSIEGHDKIIEPNPIPLFRVALGFLYFANHARVHGDVTPFKHGR